MILISKLMLIPVLSLTFFFTKFIKEFISSNDAFFLLIKKFECFFDILASPKFIFSGTDSFMSSQAFFVV